MEIALGMRTLKKSLWPHCVTLPIDDTGMKIDGVEAWLAERLGKFRDQWNAVYGHNRTDYYFKDADTATLFALKWS
jgi:hypothetical protein